ncbi:hypothetical protein GCM10022217_23830 [Chryseobacterium ginsenosidimutans]|uniref:hypothetical protein n=1 Tax=Chryseobacterium ginsenosidimutans TaxID=687846 RepID=UPI0031D5396E
MKDRNKYIIFLFMLIITECQSYKNIYMQDTIDKIANQITETNYDRLFFSGNYNLIDSLWKNGENKNVLTEIAESEKYDNHTRLLVSEILFNKEKEYFRTKVFDSLASVYAKAMIFATDEGNTRLSGNLWGFMYYSDQNNISDYGILGERLIILGNKVLPYLEKLLDNEDIILYEGSQDATLGNSLKYRVKDTAAYYIGKILKIQVNFFENFERRDAEIERLKSVLRKK